jgi:hypothetical protein
MSLDVKMLQSGLEKMFAIRPIPGIAHVDGYIKAFYIPETEYLRWCREHQHYSLKQYLSIINVGIGTTMKRKDRQDLQAALEEMDRQRRR